MADRCVCPPLEVAGEVTRLARSTKCRHCQHQTTRAVDGAPAHLVCAETEGRPNRPWK